MSPTKRGAVFFLSVATVVVIGAMGVRAIRAPAPARWPGRIAVIGLDEGNKQQPVTYLAIADPTRKTVVVVPPIAVVEVPGAGFLRAFHAWRLGGVSQVRATLGRLFGVDVPFSVVGPGGDLEAIAASFSSADILPDRLDDLRAALTEAVSDWEVKEVTGERKQGVRGPFLVPDSRSVDTAARAIGGFGTKVFVDPTREQVLVAASTSPSPSRAPSPAPSPKLIPPAQITVDVLNGGQVELAATKTANKLKPKGYQVRKIGDFTPQNRPASVVYFKAGAEAKARQVAAELGYPVEPLPAQIKSDADVLVLLGHDARV
jgi:hypothetical protein